MAAGGWLLVAVLLIGLPLYAFTAQYKGLTRYVGSAALYRLAARNGLLVLLLSGLGVVLELPMPPSSSWVLLWLLLTGFTGALRFALRDVLLNLRSIAHKQRLRVAIYGAGEAGAHWQLRCAWLATTRSSPFSTITRSTGGDPSTACRFNRPRF